MTTDPKAKRRRDAAVETSSDTTEDTKATAAPAPAAHDARGLAGLDVFPSDDAPRTGASTVAADEQGEEEEALDATKPRAAAVLLDTDAALHVAAGPAAGAPAQLPPAAHTWPDTAQDQDEPQDAQGQAGGGEDYDDEGEEDDEEDEEEDEEDKTVIAQATPRPRTLSAAFRAPREDAPAATDDAPPRHETPPPDATLPPFPVPMPMAVGPDQDQEEQTGDAIEDELDPEEEWAIADQPTIYMPPKRGAGGARPEPQQEGWPYRPRPRPGQGQGQGQGQEPGRVPSGPRPGIARPGAGAGAGAPMDRFAPIPAPRSGYDGPRLASPNGRPMPGTPPDGIPPAALADPRMERFQQLRESREAHDHGERASDEMRPVSEVMRQWWGDLLPGLRGALRHQHEAQASGVHPASPYDAPPASKLGDAFGRLAQSARDLTDRARPALQRIHDQAEHAAQKFVGRFEQPTAVQQAPFLGPGRVAIFFRTGVSVGQAHALLMRRQARPMRLIPRKHGFLAAVAPGREAEICDGLRNHPYVRDVAYISYDGEGQPMPEDDDQEQEYE